VKAIILAGGFGKRLKSVIRDIPKPMAPVNGRPFLEILVKRLMRFNITDIVLSVGYKQEVIREYFGDGSSMNASFNYSAEDIPLGTGGAVKAAMERFPSKHYVVMNGDSFFDNDIPKLITCHEINQANITMALATVDDTSRYGSVEINPDGEIARFSEKGKSGPGIINAGVYVVEQHVKDFFSENVCSFENDVLMNMIGNGLFGLCQPGLFIDIGVPDDYERASAFFEQRIDCSVVK
jgi:D-glycero-alpha-D-manno-heptose 1-phosphate guanylyltransferase